MQQPTLDRMFLALSDPGRRAMVECLSLRPATVKQLAEPLGMRLPSAVKHLKVLEEGGLVASRKRGRERTFRLQVEAMRTIGEWAHSREAAWHAAFDRLAAAMQEIDEEERQS
ncbi:MULTISPECIES: ArsR/SmtB family transcription factor [unclassified Shinella]|uniref:ArsR/SmtB family transcription factor n=1 Tax=unclassified Shinella TaxID=2643062 RepID=UPI00234F7F88|nr:MULTISPECIES: metalloregulator ArsR/SmtB family transcription factor [unclassified Shinella]MCO5152078.1 metalloregulator ArsR/SmtB family transcription factor [Shinella sp.]MDC7266630.1 metalloregulator ArsR/SmtB family transcription factor [Shinella sp. HY16]MDC7273527.1 metalloregulator ArsR/SmtB family transcription factor [Shinella sp. YZ44]